MIALTLAPKYRFGKGWLSEKVNFFIKMRVGWTKISGTDIYGNNGSETALTLGPAIGADYSFHKNWNAYIDIGGLWSSGDVEDYDFHPWNIGIRYLF